MPLPVDKLTKDSNDMMVQEAMKQSMEMCMNEPTPTGEDIPNKQKWCAGKLYGIAREKTGKDLNYGQNRGA